MSESTKKKSKKYKIIRGKTSNIVMQGDRNVFGRGITDEELKAFKDEQRI